MLRTQYYRWNHASGPMLMRVTYEESYPRKFEVKRRDNGEWGPAAPLWGYIIDGDAEAITDDEARSLEAGYGTKR